MNRIELSLRKKSSSNQRRVVKLLVKLLYFVQSKHLIDPIYQISKPGFRIRIFFADPDPGKNLHADPVPDLGGIRRVEGRRGRRVKIVGRARKPEV